VKIVRHITRGNFQFDIQITNVLGYTHRDTLPIHLTRNGERARLQTFVCTSTLNNVQRNSKLL